PEQIAMGYNRAADPRAPGLVAYLPFDEGAGTNAYDQTSFHNTGILGGDRAEPDLPAWVASNAPLALLHAPVTVRVEDGRGGFDTQSFTVDVSPGGTGEIHGTVFNDPDGEGRRGLVALPPITLNVPGMADPWLAGMGD